MIYVGEAERPRHPRGKDLSPGVNTPLRSIEAMNGALVIRRPAHQTGRHALRRCGSLKRERKMADQQQWALAWAKSSALQRNIPSEVDRTRVAEYHQILADLQAASGEDLSHFRIPDSEVKPQIIFAFSS